MVGYADNHMRNTYKLYNPDTKRVTTKRDIQWTEWKITDVEETMSMLRDLKKEDLGPEIEEDKTPTTGPEDKIPVHAIHDERESVKPNKNQGHQSLLTTIKMIIQARQYRIGY